jgi:hypothetical protein
VGTDASHSSHSMTDSEIRKAPQLHDSLAVTSHLAMFEVTTSTMGEFDLTSLDQLYLLCLRRNGSITKAVER